MSRIIILSPARALSFWLVLILCAFGTPVSDAARLDAYFRYNVQTAESVFSAGQFAGHASHMIDASLGTGRLLEYTPLGLIASHFFEYRPFTDLTNSTKDTVVGYFVEDALISAGGDWNYFSGDFDLGYSVGESYAQLTEAGAGAVTLGAGSVFTIARSKLRGSVVDATNKIAGASDEVFVLGRQVDTAVAKDWAGHNVLDIPDWTLKKNDQWVQGIIDQKGKVYLGSPQNRSTLWDAANNRPTVFSRELDQLNAAGYKQVGDYMLPPTP